MKRTIIKAVTLILAFFVGIVGSAILLNRETVSSTEELSDAVFPYLYTKANNQDINVLYGYSTPMQGNYMRDCLIPLDSEDEMVLYLAEPDLKVKSVSYQVRSLDTSRLIVAGEEQSIAVDGEEKYLSLDIQNLLTANQEYLLNLILHIDEEQTIYYYTRIAYLPDNPLEEYLKFAEDFAKKSMDEEKALELTTYLEPSEEGDNSSFAKVDIHSSFQQVKWGQLAPVLETEPRALVKELNSQTGIITQNYVVSTTNGERTSYYIVNEYYRMRYSTTRIYLLDFKRTMNQVFLAAEGAFGQNNLNLGITESVEEFESSEDGSIVAFVQTGELWGYNNNSGKVSRIFSFRKEDNTDPREMNDQFGLKIINMDESGSLNFLLYGYMSRGKHEGQVGVSVYHYSSDTNSVEEEVFIPSTKSYQLLKEDIGNLAYINNNNELFLMLDGSVYCIDLYTTNYRTLIQGLEEGGYTVSQDGRRIAWIGGEDANRALTIETLDLETGQRESISPEDSNTFIKPLTYMDHDLIYGFVRKADIVVQETGMELFPMHQILIQDPAGNIAEEYKIKGVYTIGIDLMENMITLSRVRKEAGGYKEINDDQIIINRAEETSKTKVGTIAVDVRETEYVISFEKTIYDKSKKILTPKLVINEENRELELERIDRTDSLYYVYAKGGLFARYTELTEAIHSADEQMGVVVDCGQNYIWQRASFAVPTQADLNDIPSGFDSGIMNISQLETQSGKTVVDLQGCTMDQMMYYLSRGSVVIGLKSVGEPVLIVGYDEFNLILAEPGSDTTYKYGLNDSREMFQNAGNVFVSYLD